MLQVQPVDQLFIVTESGGLYLARNQRTDQGFAFLQKIAVSSASSSETAAGTPMNNGYWLGITDNKATLYNTHRTLATGRPHPPCEVNTVHWGGNTTGIVGLFMVENDARQALNAGDLTVWDVRWSDETSKALLAIGDRHPVFVIDPRVAVARAKNPIQHVPSGPSVEVCPECNHNLRSWETCKVCDREFRYGHPNWCPRYDRGCTHP